MTRRLLPPLVLLLALLAAAEAAIRLAGVDPAVLPRPSAVVARLVDHARVLADAAAVTLGEVLLGLAWAIAAGLLAAIAMHRFALVDRALHPLLVASQAVPTPALAPALALWLGYTLWTRAAVVALVAVFPVAVATHDALRRADGELLDLYRSFGATRWRVLWEVELPGAVPAAISGVRVAAAFSVVGAVFGEWVGASDGLGYLILTANNALHADLVFAAVLWLAAIGLALVAACSLLERRLFGWRWPDASGARERPGR